MRRGLLVLVGSVFTIQAVAFGASLNAGQPLATLNGQVPHPAVTVTPTPSPTPPRAPFMAPSPTPTPTPSPVEPEPTPEPFTSTPSPTPIPTPVLEPTPTPTSTPVACRTIPGLSRQGTEIPAKRTGWEQTDRQCPGRPVPVQL